MKKIFHSLSFRLITVTLLLLFLHWLNILKPTEESVRKLLTPLQSGIYSAGQGINDFFHPWFLKKDLNEKNIELDKKVEELVLENARLELLEEENESLRKELNFFKKRDYRFVLTNVVGKDVSLPESEGHIFILDRGEIDGIKAGYPVIVAPTEIKSVNDEIQEEGFLVGKIAETDKYTSKLLLLSDGQSSAAVSILGEREIAGVISGGYPSTLKMDFILPDKKIEAGNLVVTSGAENDIPAGLVAGEVEKVEYKPGDFFQKADIKPLIPFDNLKILAVLIPREEK